MILSFMELTSILMSRDCGRLRSRLLLLLFTNGLGVNQPTSILMSRDCGRYVSALQKSAD